MSKSKILTTAMSKSKILTTQFIPTSKEETAQDNNQKKTKKMISNIQAFFQSFPNPFLTKIEQVSETGLDLTFEWNDQQDDRRIVVCVRESTGGKFSIRTRLDGVSRNFSDYAKYLQFQKKVNDYILLLVSYINLNVE